MSSDFIVEMKNISKSFGNTHAIIEGHFNLKKGEIHALIGENGAGKSTMMKILYGLYSPDKGQVLINNQEIQFSHYSPKVAIENAIGMVHQEFMLVNELTVLDNIILGVEPRKGPLIDFDEAKKKINTYLDNYNISIQLDKCINQISTGEAQRVEIIKTLYRGADILILDEPTAVLTPQETNNFFEILHNLTQDGKSVIFISHKLQEVMKISDRITVMRQGNFIDSLSKQEASIPSLAKLMVGREVFLNVEKEPPHLGNVMLEVKGLWTSGEKETSKIRDVSFSVHEGEVLGIAGIDGNGQSEIIEAIAGLRKVEKGKVFVDNQDVTNKTPLAIRKSGLTHIPEDRNTSGLNRQLTVMENMMALKVDEYPYSKFGVQDFKMMHKFTSSLTKKFDVRPNKTDILTSSLSGGNAQKVVVAREVEENGKILIASQPSRGVDIGAIESIRKILNEVKAEKKALLLISADIEEILALSDRIAVMFEGKIAGIIDAKDAFEETIGKLMTGAEL